MSIWHYRGMPSGPGGRKPRFNPLMVALPLGALLLFNAVTGRIDLTSAFDDNAMDSIRAQRSIIAATVIAQRTATAGGQAVLVPSEATPTPTAADPTVASPPACEPAGDDRYCLYTVESGDSLASIARAFDLDGGLVAGWELIFESNRPDLGSMDEPLQIGMVLRIPNQNGVLHLLMPGESVSGLAVDYDVTTEAIVAANPLADPNSVQIGDIVFVPEPAQVPADEIVVAAEEPIEQDPAEEPDAGDTDEPQPEEDLDEEPTEPSQAEGEEQPEEQTDEEEEQDQADAPDEDEAPEGERDEPDASEKRRDQAAEDDAREDEEPDESSDGADEPAETPEEGEDESDQAPEPEREPEPEPAPPEPDDPTHMAWPVVQVKITNYMSARHPLGMDFGLGAAPTSPIMAAAGGTVSFAGGDPCCSYGYYVIVDHGNGLQTLYAHFSSISVRKGDQVGRGQTLGIAGDTGNSRGVHLHFEVYKNGKRVDPLPYLPD